MRAFSAVLLLLLSAGCGAGGAGASPAQTPSSEPAGSGEDENGLTDTDSRFAQPPSSTGDKEDDAKPLDLAAATARFDQSASQLSSESVLDCGKACKALGSMERSMSRICELVGDDDPEHRCESARDKARAARERVEKHCPRCG